ncbi:hypothetical protein NE237_030644 [Protea cynaroides]|uniref:Transmembrane protein n=1 Tax=Protea cynaroides TaxID=273540 RepID=A0A9Q0GTF2_9MAGN|nr:hypothetical protein NE237_030644 [Protea cynaroides]
MSGGSGTPVAGGFMRKRLSQGSSGDDLEDDACSRFQLPAPQISKSRTWIEVVENVLWIASFAFIIYFGDRHSNLIYLLWRDDRIRRWPLYLGMVGIVLNVGILFYTSLLGWGFRKYEEKSDVLTSSAAPVVALLGILSYFLLCIALWPIWSFLTLPLLFSLFMACIVSNNCYRRIPPSTIRRAAKLRHGGAENLAVCVAVSGVNQLRFFRYFRYGFLILEVGSSGDGEMAVFVLSVAALFCRVP